MGERPVTSDESEPSSGTSVGADAAGNVSGRVVAAVSVRPGPDGAIVTGMVDPEFRGRGIGARLLDVALETADGIAAAGAVGAAGVDAQDVSGGAGGAGVTVESEGLSAGAEGLFASRGFRLVFAEDVMRIELAGGQRRIPLGTDGRPETGSVPGAEITGRFLVPETTGRSPEAEITGRFLGSETTGRSPEAEITGRFPGSETAGRSPEAEITGRFPGTEITEWAPGIEITEWAPGTGSRFHAVYAAAFRERPGFPDPPAAEWIEETAEEDDFRADWSLLATVPGIGDAGFVTATEGWIVQVGVVPAARGTGLGAALIRESLRRAAAAGFGESWLCVNADNPAANLYRRLGFQHRGRRARYRRSPA